MNLASRILQLENHKNTQKVFVVQIMKDTDLFKVSCDGVEKNYTHKQYKELCHNNEDSIFIIMPDEGVADE